MRGPFHPTYGSVGSRRGSPEPVRPIAAGLKLGTAHLDTIDQSHQRCAALGVSRIERPDHSPLGRSDLAVVRERNLRLHDHAAPVMEMLHEQIINTQNMVVLCDATGTILHSIGDDEFLARACKVALQPGVNWSEHTKGTNAIGTALIEELPTRVHADEHYMHANHFLTCSAAPILDPRGNILGVLDVTGDRSSFHPHTMALVKMSARMIENHWLTDDYRHVMRLHFHSRVEFLGTLMEGILAVSADGRIVGANRGALEHLGLSGAALRKNSLASLFGTTVGALVDRFRSPLSTPLPVQSAGGRQFHLHARFDWPVWTSLAEAVCGTRQPGPALPRGAAPPDDGVLPAPEASANANASANASANPNPNADPARPDSHLARLRTGDAQVASLIDKLRLVIDHDIPVLILGETGTGKALLARAAHLDSRRARQPFVVVNCAAIPDTLIEAELLGCAHSAFSGAHRPGAVGKIVQADGGTLFLDEIGDLPLALQARLLHVLQTRQVTPLGSQHSVAVDVAIVCATQRNLRQMIDHQAFREDLFYRLNGLAVRLPPLRERSDLLALVRRILDQLAEPERRALPLVPDADVLQLFARCAWPGNVRQLVNVLRTAALLAGPGPVISRAHLPDDLQDDAGPAPCTAAPVPAASAPPAAVQRSLDAMQIEAIQQAVDAAAGNISEASKRLGISRNTIYRKLRWRAPQ